MTHTAEQFARARFATHPDGRIAARLDDDGFPWVGSGEAFRDAEMPAEGFVPLSESLPFTVTLVEHFPDGRITGGRGVAVRCRCGREFWAAGREVDGPISEENNTWRVAERRHAEHVLSAAPAPTTDEDDSIIASQAACLREAHRERREAEARAEEAEQERDEAIREAEELGNALDNAKPMDAPMTAREHLDAAWSAAHVPSDGIIPDHVEHVRRFSDGRIEGPTACAFRSGTPDINGTESRLLDPPTPKRPEGARDVEAVLAGIWPSDRPGLADAADTLTLRGVRVTEDGEGER